MAHSLGAEALNLIPVDDHCGEHLSLRKQDIERYNAQIAPAIAERALALGLMRTNARPIPLAAPQRRPNAPGGPLCPGLV